MTNQTIHQGVRYKAVGRCIYCGRTAEKAGGTLTLEHIIPESLGGNLKLPDASCTKCQLETHAFEGYCAGTYFINAREAMGIPSKRKGGQPTHLIILKNKPGGGFDVELIPAEEHPPVLMLPILPPPNFFDGRQSSESVHLNDMWAYFFPDSLKRWDKLQRSGYSIGTQFRPDKFCRLLAKIAHAFGVARLGLNGFTPYLPDTILGEENGIFRYVGGPESTMHALAFCRHKDDMLVSVAVQLFAQFNAPVYQVVLGKAADQEDQNLPS